MKKFKTILLLAIFFSATNIAVAQTINVNTATAKEITQIKGIGTKTLDKIKDKISFDINN